MVNFWIKPNKKTFIFYINFLPVNKKFLIIFLFFTAHLDVVNAAEVYINNDLEKQSEGRVLEIDHIVSKDAPKSKFRLTLYPEEIKPLAAGSITHFNVSRVFPTHKVKYEIECLAKEEKVEITLAQIHADSMGPLCKLKKFGHWSKRSGLKWLEVR
jgi:hypothetical protein